MISAVAPMIASILLFGLSTYFGVFVLRTFVRKGEVLDEMHQGSASRIRAGSRWIAPTTWVLLVWVLALFVGFFLAFDGPPPMKPSRFDRDNLPAPVVPGAF